MVKYYDEITSTQDTFLSLLYRIISSLSFIPYISLFILYFFGKIQSSFTMIVNIQLCIACMMHSISYLFPSMANAASTTTVLCYIQSLINSLSDLCSIMLATATIIISFLNFKNPDIVINNKRKILFFLCLICWLFPLIFCIIIFIYGDVNSGGSAFCWVNNYTVIYCYYSFCFVNYFTFFFVLYKISNGIKKILIEDNSIESIDKYMKTFKYFSFVVCMDFCVFSLNFATTTVFAINRTIPGQIYFGFLLLAQLGEMALSPAYVIFYCFNKEKAKELRRVICCKKDNVIIDDIPGVEFDNLEEGDDSFNF